MSDCKLNQEAQIDMSITKKRKSQAKKITGFHVMSDSLFPGAHLFFSYLRKNLALIV